MQANDNHNSPQTETYHGGLFQNRTDIFFWTAKRATELPVLAKSKQLQRQGRSKNFVGLEIKNEISMNLV